MKSWRLDGASREHLHLVEQAQPEAGQGEVVVRTRAVSLNYRDKAIIDGIYPEPPKFPIVLASDMAGEITALGAGVTGFKAGDKVISVFKPFWIDGPPAEDTYNQMLGSPLTGVLSEYVVLPVSGVLPYPEYLTPAHASTLPVAYVTAWMALFNYGGLRAGQTVLVQGSGGVSLAALQLAVAQGARVIATSRSESKIERLKELGASEVINTVKIPAWEGEVRRLTGGKGVDHVVEVLGGTSLQRSILSCAMGGQIALIGFMEEQDGTISVPHAIGSAVRLQGVGVGSRKDTRDLLDFLERHRIAPVIDATYAFDDAPSAFDHLDRGPFGKTVVAIAS